MSSPRPTISDVARRAGVSISTVSRVVNGSAAVDSGTAQRVQAAIAELSYTPHAAARTLATRRTQTIGLLLPNIGGQFYTPLLRGIESVASQAGYDLLIHSTSTPAGASFQRALGEHNTDGLIIFTEAVDREELVRLCEMGFPVVLLYESAPKGVKMPSITIENRQGAQKIVEHLIEAHGRKRIIFLRGPQGNEDSDEREKGYRQALATHQIPFDAGLLATGGFESGQAHVAMKQFIENGTDFDAVFAGDDDNAVGVIQALQEAGLRIPQDVAVAGFDDSTFARLLTPPLTTVRAPVEQVGREGVRQLLRLIHAESARARVTLPVELVIRQSCGCPQVDSE